MASVDEHIVSMQFDNKQFEKNVASTILAIEQLRKSLNFADTSRSLHDLSVASKSIKLDALHGMASGIDHVASRFTAMGAIGFSVIQSLTSRILNIGINLAKNLSLSQVISGFREYELNLNSIQTILANTKADGTNLEQVNAALDQLNEYSDKTIYNFGQMARNIGTFTAAGIDLDTSVTAIKGIANLAAVSGSNAEQASTAMYQLSQAIATGTVRIIDWTSVVNAGMGGEVFQKALFESGKAFGTIKNVKLGTTFEQWTDAGNSFRGSLEQGWLTADVLTATLQGFTGDLTDAQLLSMGYTAEQVKQIQEFAVVAQDAATKVKTFTQLLGTVRESIGSGWSASFRIIIGDFEEARTMFTEFNNSIGAVVGKSADARNDMLQDWKDMGGRTVLIDSIKVAFSGLARIFNVIKAAFKDVFPKLTAKRLYQFSLSIYGLVYNLNQSRETLWEVRKALAGFFSIFSIGFEIITEFSKMIFRLFKDIFKGSDALGFFSDMGVKLSALEKKLVDGGGIATFFRDLEDKIREFGSFIAPAIDKIKDIFGTLATRLKNFFSNISTGNLIDKLKTLASDVQNVFKNLLPSGQVNAIKDRISGISSVFDRLNQIFQDAWEFLKKIGLLISETAQKVWSVFKGIGERIGKIFGNINYDQVLDTINTGLFAGFVLLFRKFVLNSADFGGIAKGIKDVLGELIDTLKTMQTDIKANAILKIATALALFAVSILLLAQIDPQASTRALAILAAGFGILAGGLIVLYKALGVGTGAIKLMILATALVAVAGALLILSIAMKIFATMEWDEIARGLAGAAGGIAILVGAMHLMPKGLGGAFRSMGLIGMAIALTILAGAVKLFAMMSLEELARGLGAIAVGLLIMSGAMQLMPNGIGSVFKGLGLIALAIALNILAGAVALFAAMSVETLARGLISIAAGLLIIAGAMHLMPNGITMMLQAAALLMVGTALVSIATAMKIMSTLSWEEMGRGLAGIAGALLILVGIGHLMSGNILGAVAIGLMAGALLLLSVAIREMSKISWKQLAVGLGAIAITFAVLAAAAMLMGPILPLLFGLGAALLLLGVATIAIGFGMSLLASAFAILATSGSAAIDVIMSAIMGIVQILPPLILGLVKVILEGLRMILTELPGFIAQLSDSVGAVIQLIIDNIPGFVAALTLFVQEGLEAIRVLFPDIVATGFAMIMNLLTGIRDNMFEIATTVGEIIVAFLDALALQIPDIVASGVDTIVAFLQGITDGLPEVVPAVVALISEFITQIGKQEHIDDIVESIFTLLINVIEAIGRGISRLATSLLTTVGKLITKLAEQLPPFIGTLVDALFTFLINTIKELTSKIEKNAGKLGTAIGELWAAIVIGFITALGSVAVAFVKKLADAIYDKFMDAIWNVVDKFLPGDQGNPFKVLGLGIVDEVIGWVDTGLEDAHHPAALDDFVWTMASMVGKMNSVLSSGIDYSPTITPVMDLSQLKADAAQIKKMVPSSLDASYSAAASIAGSENQTTQSSSGSGGSKEITFTQINNSPEALSNAAIYRQTRNQIAMAKEELATL